MASVESHLRGSIGNCRCEHDASHLTYVKNSVFIRPCISRHWKSTQPPGGGDRPIRSCAFPESGCPWPSVALQLACRDDMAPSNRTYPLGRSLHVALSPNLPRPARTTCRTIFAWRATCRDDMARSNRTYPLGRSLQVTLSPNLPRPVATTCEGPFGSRVACRAVVRRI